MDGPYRCSQKVPWPHLWPWRCCRYRYVLLKFQTPVCPFSTKNFAKMSVFLVKTLKIRWRLRLWLVASLCQILNASLISPLFLVACFVNFSPSLIFSKPRFISNSNEAPNFTVIFIICAKFGVKAGAQNSFLPPGAGYPSYATAGLISFQRRRPR